MKPGGLFYMGVYGGPDFEGIRPDDRHEPKRFFASYPDRVLLERVTQVFDLRYFRRLEVEPGTQTHFQSLILAKPSRIP
jgi:hypothetical protein